MNITYTYLKGPHSCEGCGEVFKDINYFEIEFFFSSHIYTMRLCEGCANDIENCILQNCRTTEEE